jgi:hypothetical protein
LGQMACGWRRNPDFAVRLRWCAPHQRHYVHIGRASSTWQPATARNSVSPCGSQPVRILAFSTAAPPPGSQHRVLLSRVPLPCRRGEVTVLASMVAPFGAAIDGTPRESWVLAAARFRGNDRASSSIGAINLKKGTTARKTSTSAANGRKSI